MLDLGYVLPGSTLNIPFATYDSNDPSASVTTTGLAVTDIEIYKDGSLTQRASDAGYAVDIDFDTLTGLHTIQIDLADNTTAGFFAAGSEYLVAVSSITVDAATVSLWAARFIIGIPGMIHGSSIAAYTSTDNFTLNTGSADDDAYNGCIFIAYDVATRYQMQIGVIEDYTGLSKTVNLKADPGVFTMAANDNIIIMPPALLPTTPGNTLDVTTTGAAGIDWGNVENKTTANDLSATDIQLCDTVTTNTDMRGTDSALLAASAPTNFSDLAITVTTGQVTVGTNNDKTGYALTQSFPSNFADLSITATTGRVDVAAVGGTAQTANDNGADINEILTDTGTTIPAQISGLNNISTAEVNAEVVDALATDTYAEPGQGTPGATISLSAKISYLYKAWRNRSTQTATTYSLYADDATTVDQKATVSDDGSTADKGEIATGP